MKGRRILAAVFLLPAIATGYATWVTWRAGEDGTWLFGVFTLFLLILAAVPLAPEFQPRPKPEPPHPTGFRPHWFMLLVVLALVGGVLNAIVRAILD